jgi:hypothetical protein
MGGKLLSVWNLPEKRMPNSDYIRLKDSLVNKLQNDHNFTLLYNLKIGVAPCIRSKMDHGDLDIIVGTNYSNTGLDKFTPRWKGHAEFREYIKSEFGYAPHQNTNVFSFPVEGFQVDVTFVPREEYDMSISYCSWGDVSNLVGRVFHRMGGHYGHTGLSFWIRQGLFDGNIEWSDSDHIYEKCILSRNVEEIFKIGGFDFKRWQRGFDTEEDAFDFVVNSEYFDSSLFDLENLNHTNRTRNRKRGMYMRFIEYIGNKNVKNKAFLPKGTYSLILQNKFPVLRNAISQYRLQYEIDKNIKGKVNGKLIMEWLNTTDGPLVGTIMKTVKGMGKDILLSMSSEEIKAYVMAL